MPPKKAEDGSQQSISSFFSRAAAPQKRESVLVLDSSDEEEGVKDQAGRGGRAAQGAKRVKTEHDGHDSQLQPVASSSKLPTTATSPPRDGPKPQSAASQRLRQFAYSQPDPTAPKPPSRPSSVEQARHDAFVKKLSLGPDLLKRRTSYLQKDHYLAARDNDGAEDAGSPGGGFGSSSLAGEDLDEDADSDSSSTSTLARGKGKGKAKATDSDETSSRLAKFAAKGSKTGGKGASEAKVKYTPLEQQVLALRKAHPGVLLVIEVGYKCASPQARPPTLN